MMKKVVIGIDLAGSDKRDTGFCVMDDKLNAKAFIVHTDDELFQAIRQIRPKPKVIAIDAPLCLPLGRKRLEDRDAPHIRACDRALYPMKIRFFPITLGPMRKLTARGIMLKNKLEKQGHDVIEVFPGGAQDILKIARKQDGMIRLMNGLKRQGIKGLHSRMNGDELDAVTSALVGLLYHQKNYTALGDAREGFMIMPKIQDRT